MAIKLSSGLRNHMLVTGSFKAGLDGGVMRIYGGTIPAAADDALASATLLCTISLDATGTGITFESTVTAGILVKKAAEIWRGQITTSGTATFFRFVPIADDGTASTTAKRIQGTVNVVGADLNFSSVAFVAPNYKVIDSLNVTIPLA